MDAVKCSEIYLSLNVFARQTLWARLRMFGEGPYGSKGASVAYNCLLVGTCKDPLDLARMSHRPSLQVFCGHGNPRHERQSA